MMDSRSYDKNPPRRRVCIIEEVDVDEELEEEEEDAAAAAAAASALEMARMSATKSSIRFPDWTVLEKV